ncbi:putative ATP18 subunit I/j of the mitochondrial F1F0-ATP synthase [Limtongia smithiae]|uniref:putative ATP18 subunit I/j of the mitochondrial F1F0-ATP synthase n=1 Tax=Limtongia smithiae TaxID=1125753 RepID=UPI0034CF867B
MASAPLSGAFLGWKKYPTPIFKPLWPFFIGAGLTYYGVSKFADLLMDTDEFKNDPRNPKNKH